MKLKSFLVMLFTLVLVVFSGCVGKGSNKEVAGEYEKFKKSLPPAEWQPTGVRCVDDAGILSAKLYSQAYKYLQEYVAATENNRYYVGLMNEVDDIKKNENLDDLAALQKAFNNIAEADKKRPAGEDPVLPRVIEGYNAVQALKPTNKLRELVPMLPPIADLILRAKKIPNEVKEELKNDPMKIYSATKSGKNVQEQTNYTQKIVQYLIIQYKRNQEMQNYMKD